MRDLPLFIGIVTDDGEKLLVSVETNASGGDTVRVERFDEAEGRWDTPGHGMRVAVSHGGFVFDGDDNLIGESR